jgi:hypothetical protein
MTMSLYEVGVEGLELERILTESDGELTPDTEQRLDTFLKQGKEKIDAACMVVRQKKLSEDALDAEIARLEARKTSFVNDRKMLEARILGAVDAAFDGKVKTNLFTVWGQTSAETVGFDIAPDADLASIQKVYPEVVRTKYELDKKTLKEMHKHGESLPNAVTVIENPGTRYLRIK